jgi:hypothetical protein
MQAEKVQDNERCIPKQAQKVLQHIGYSIRVGKPQANEQLLLIANDDHS